MMVPKKSLFFAGATLLCMSTAFAQSAQSKKIGRVSNKVMTTASMDLQTGVITRGPNIMQKAAGPTATVVTVNNLDFAGFLGVDSGPDAANGPCEWFSSVAKGTAGTGGESTYLQSYVFAYCSVAKDPLSGGAGATASMGFWDGFVPGMGLTAGTMGTNVLTATLTGLPANTGLTSFLTNGFQVCRVGLFNVGLGGGTVPFVLPDSNVAISFRYDDTASDGVLAATATFFSCIASCSGTIGVADGQGMIDRFDNYCGGAFLTSFSFQTQGQPSITSISFSITELCGIDASDSVVSSNGSGVNTQVLTVPDAADLGGTHSLSADCTGFPAASNAILRLAFIPGTPAILGGSKGELLVALGGGNGVNSFVPHGGGVANFSFGTLPLDLTFFGFPLNAQGFCGTGGAATPGATTNLTNLVTYVVGSQE